MCPNLSAKVLQGAFKREKVLIGAFSKYWLFVTVSIRIEEPY